MQNWNNQIPAAAAEFQASNAPLHGNQSEQTRYTNTVNGPVVQSADTGDGHAIHRQMASLNPGQSLSGMEPCQQRQLLHQLSHRTGSSGPINQQGPLPATQRPFASNQMIYQGQSQPAVYQPPRLQLFSYENNNSPARDYIPQQLEEHERQSFIQALAIFVSNMRAIIFGPVQHRGDCFRSMTNKIDNLRQYFSQVLQGYQPVGNCFPEAQNTINRDGMAMTSTPAPHFSSANYGSSYSQQHQPSAIQGMGSVSNSYQPNSIPTMPEASFLPQQQLQTRPVYETVNNNNPPQLQQQYQTVADSQTALGYHRPTQYTLQQTSSQYDTVQAMTSSNPDYQQVDLTTNLLNTTPAHHQQHSQNQQQRQFFEPTQSQTAGHQLDQYTTQPTMPQQTQMAQTPHQMQQSGAISTHSSKDTANDNLSILDIDLTLPIEAPNQNLAQCLDDLITLLDGGKGLSTSSDSLQPTEASAAYGRKPARRSTENHAPPAAPEVDSPPDGSNNSPDELIKALKKATTKESKSQVLNAIRGQWPKLYDALIYRNSKVLAQRRAPTSQPNSSPLPDVFSKSLFATSPRPETSHRRVDDSLLLSNEEWLNTSQIMFGLELLRAQFPHIVICDPSHLHDEKKPLAMSNSTILIANVRKHWVTLSNINTSGKWFLLDSLFGNDHLKSLKPIFKKIKRAADLSGRFCITVPQLPRQSGTNDCGLFALAYAFALANNEDPGCLKFQQSQMRPHFNSCVTTNRFSCFPSVPIDEPKRLTFNLNL